MSKNKVNIKPIGVNYHIDEVSDLIKDRVVGENLYEAYFSGDPIKSNDVNDESLGEARELRKGLIHCTINPLNGEPINLDGKSLNPFMISNAQYSFYDNRLSETSQQENEYVNGSIRSHFALLATKAITDMINLANYNLDEAIYQIYRRVADIDKLEALWANLSYAADFMVPRRNPHDPTTPKMYLLSGEYILYYRSGLNFSRFKSGNNRFGLIQPTTYPNSESSIKEEIENGIANVGDFVNIDFYCSNHMEVLFMSLIPCVEAMYSNAVDVLTQNILDAKLLDSLLLTLGNIVVQLHCGLENVILLLQEEAKNLHDYMR